MKINKRLISFSSFALLVFSMLLVVGCEDNVANDNVVTNIDYIGIEPIKTVSLPGGDMVTVEASVFASRATSSDRVIGLSIVEGTPDDTILDVEASNFSAPSSVTIPAGETQGTFTVDVSATDYLQRKIVIELVPDASFNIAVTGSDEVELEDGTVLADSVDYSKLTIFAQQPCDATIVTLSITTDDYPEETSWELFDLTDLSEPIYTGGPYPNDANTVLDIPFCLPSGSYGIIVHDSWGDGISGGGFSVSIGGTAVASGIVGPSSDPGNLPSYGSAVFNVD